MVRTTKNSAVAKRVNKQSINRACINARRDRSLGFTLIEVLIALVILMGLMFTANYSYSLYTQYWHGRIGNFDQTLFYYRGLLQLKETLDSSIPYIVRGGEGVKETFYFLGRTEGFTVVTAAPIFATTVNDAAVVRVFSERKGDGYQLVYEEAPLSDKVLINIDQQLDFRYRTVLMVSQYPIKFEYFGWSSMEHKVRPNGKPESLPSWRAQYDAATTRVQPKKVKITINGQDLEYDLPEGHQSLIDFYLEELS